VRTAGTSTEIRTEGAVAVVNVTPEVRRALGQSGIRSGLAVVSVPHTTCGVCINEDEAGLKEDMTRVVSRLLEPLAREEAFHHDRIDDNARAHLAAILVGHSATIPISEGVLRLGTWQSVFLLEMDGPRTRKLDITFLGE
jgi:secondary thiamine-phosphate synthase enzyme